MDEEVKTAETNIVDNYAEVVTEKEEDVKFADGEQENKGEDKAEAVSKPEDKENPKQTPEENAKFARERRDAEHKQEVENARIQSIIEAVEVNPYTNEPIKDAADVKEYLTMKEIKKGGGDPIADYSKFVKNKQKEEVTKTQETQVTAQQKKEWFKKDAEDFKAKHPEVNLKNVLSDKDFVQFVGNNVGVIHLDQLYNSHQNYKKSVEEKAIAKAQETTARKVANKDASPGALKSTDAPDDVYTLEQLKKMSDSDMDKNWAKVEKSFALVAKK